MMRKGTDLANSAHVRWAARAGHVANANRIMPPMMPTEV
jgi:hypothetical protein